VARNLVKRFGGVAANNGINLSIHANARVGIWGPNGSGKSTFLNVIGGQLSPTSGDIQMFGRRINSLRPDGRARMGLARTFQQARVFHDVSVRRNLLPSIVSSTGLQPMLGRDLDRCLELAELALRAVGLPEGAYDNLAGTLSTGQRKRLELARVLLANPRLVLLDEPTAGVDRNGVPMMQEILAGLFARLKVAMIVVDHDLPFLINASDTIVCMAGGEIIDSFPSSSPTVIKDLLAALELRTELATTA
jgi:branched-chain amino acid transport system ATP-binding protein